MLTLFEMLPIQTFGEFQHRDLASAIDRVTIHDRHRTPIAIRYRCAVEEKTGSYLIRNGSPLTPLSVALGSPTLLAMTWLMKCVKIWPPLTLSTQTEIPSPLPDCGLWRYSNPPTGSRSLEDR
jgi:hypothetical protein